MEPPLEKLVGRKVIITTNDDAFYSGELTEYNKEREVATLKDAHINYHPKLNAKQVLYFEACDITIPLKSIKKHEKLIRWGTPFPAFPR